MFEAILQITIYLVMVLAPVLVPAAIHAVYVVRERLHTYPQGRAARLPRATAFRRLAVPAAA